MDGLNVNPEVMNALVETLTKEYGIVKTSDMDKALADLVKRGAERQKEGKNTFSLSKMIRGLRIIEGRSPVNERTVDEDVAYVKALDTGTTPGSYLVPTIQADEIIQYLTIGGVGRAAGFRVWPMNGVQKLNVPAATGAPSWAWIGENTSSTPSDPNLGQMAFDLKERRCLVAIPNQLLAVSVPAFDSLLAELIGLGAAEHEDTALFSTASVANGPAALYANASITKYIVAADTTNGGALAYPDLLTAQSKSAAAKAKGPFIWLFSPRTWYDRVLGLEDSQGRPLAVPTAFSGLTGPKFPGAVVSPVGMLFGHPAYVTPAIPEDETNGTGTAQSHFIFTNPKYVHIAQDGNIEMAISTERYFENNQTAVRAVQHEDFGYKPEAGIVVCAGID